jgi:uncharacterized membrane protein
MRVLVVGATGLIAGAIVWMQIRMRELAAAAEAAGEALPRSYYRGFYPWFGFGFPPFWLMITRPMIYLSPLT